MFNHQNKAILIRLIDEVWNKGNLTVVEELIAPRYTIQHDPGDAYELMTLDLSVFKQRVRHARGVFPNLNFKINDLVCEDEKIATSWFMTGTQKGDLPNLSATGKQINVAGLTIYYFAAGKITGHWQVFDRLSLMEQLGVQIGRS